jgi:hypothetical protein
MRTPHDSNLDLLVDNSSCVLSYTGEFSGLKLNLSSAFVVRGKLNKDDRRPGEQVHLKCNAGSEFAIGVSLSLHSSAKVCTREYS